MSSEGESKGTEWWKNKGPEAHKEQNPTYNGANPSVSLFISVCLSNGRTTLQVEVILEILEGEKGALRTCKDENGVQVGLPLS